MDYFRKLIYGEPKKFNIDDDESDYLPGDDKRVKDFNELSEKRRLEREDMEEQKYMSERRRGDIKSTPIGYSKGRPVFPYQLLDIQSQLYKLERHPEAKADTHLGTEIRRLQKYGNDILGDVSTYYPNYEIFLTRYNYIHSPSFSFKKASPTRKEENLKQLVSRLKKSIERDARPRNRKSPTRKSPTRKSPTRKSPTRKEENLKQLVSRLKKSIERDARPRNRKSPTRKSPTRKSPTRKEENLKQLVSRLKKSIERDARPRNRK
jgi:hypothetical protein